MVVKILITIYLIVVGLELPHAYKAAMQCPPENKTASALTALSVSIMWPILWTFGVLFWGTMFLVNLLTGKRND